MFLDWEEKKSWQDWWRSENHGKDQELQTVTSWNRPLWSPECSIPGQPLECNNPNAPTQNISSSHKNHSLILVLSLRNSQNHLKRKCLIATKNTWTNVRKILLNGLSVLQSLRKRHKSLSSWKEKLNALDPGWLKAFSKTTLTLLGNLSRQQWELKHTRIQSMEKPSPKEKIIVMINSGMTFLWMHHYGVKNVLQL